MDIIHAIALGLVEGFTEFLPVSSTGHLILTGQLLHIPATEFWKSFDIIIQLGAITAVVFLYWRSFLDIEVLKRLIVGFIPTGIVGLLLYSLIKTYLLGNAYVVVAALLLGGIALIAFEILHTDATDESSVLSISYKQSFMIGLFQSVAIVPGVSRSAATIVGGLLIGIPRKTIVEFSFLLAVPTMAAATGLDILKNAGSFSTANIGVIATGFFVSFFVALLSIKFLLAYVKNHSFVAFGVYRIVIAALFFFVVLV